VPSAENQVWSTDLPPNGTWQAERTIDDFVPTGMLVSVAEREFAGVYTKTFKDGKYTMIFEDLQGQLHRCQGDYELVEEDIVRLTITSDPHECSFGPDDFQWRIDDEGLHLHLVASNGGPPGMEWTPFYEATPWQKIEEWSQGLPPNGVWQVELTTDDFVSMGVMKSVAETEWAGVYTITFEDGKYVMIWEGLQGQLGRCQADYELVEEDVVRLKNTNPSECSFGPDDIQWRMDDEGLHLHLVPQKSGLVDVEMTAFYEAKTWQKIADQ
jgi:hypothetical protein